MEQGLRQFEQLPLLKTDMIVEQAGEAGEGFTVRAGQLLIKFPQRRVFGQCPVGQRAAAGSGQRRQHISLFGQKVGLKLAGKKLANPLRCIVNRLRLSGLDGNAGNAGQFECQVVFT